MKDFKRLLFSAEASVSNKGCTVEAEYWRECVLMWSDGVSGTVVIVRLCDSWLDGVVVERFSEAGGVGMGYECNVMELVKKHFLKHRPPTAFNPQLITHFNPTCTEYIFPVLLHYSFHFIASWSWHLASFH